MVNTYKLLKQNDGDVSKITLSLRSHILDTFNDQTIFMVLVLPLLFVHDLKKKSFIGFLFFINNYKIYGFAFVHFLKLVSF